MTAEAIGNLYASLGLNSGQFDAGLDRAGKKLKDFGKVDIGKGLKAGLDEVDGSLKTLAGNAGALGNILSGLGIGGVAAAAAIALAFDGARDAMAFADEIGDTANKLQVTTDYLQEMRFVAHGLGGEFQDADAAIEAFTKNFGLATSGLSAKALKPFETLGLDPKSFATVDEALRAVIDRISQLDSVAEQAAIADKLGLTPMLPALREGSTEIDRMRQKAHDLGYVMDSEMIAKAGDLNDQYENLTSVLDVQVKSAFVDLGPVIVDLMGLTVQWLDKLQSVASVFQDIESRRTKDLEATRDRLLASIAQNQSIINLPGARAYNDYQQGKLDKVNAELESRRRADLERLTRTPTGTTLPNGGGGGGGGTRNNAAAAAARQAAAAEREHAAALKAEAAALHDAEQKSADYLAGLLEEVGVMGMSTEALKRRRSEMEAAAAPTEALANQIREVEKQRRAQSQVAQEAADKEKQVNDQMAETVTTLYDLIGLRPHFTTTFESMAMDLDKASGFARGLSYDVDDIARALNDNDWTSAMAGLANVLANVERAFKSAATAQEKFNAVAGVAQVVGGAVGGTAGSALSGAASGAMAGNMLLPGIGGVIGGVLGGLGSIFGSSKAKKQAKAQAAAQKAAEEAQRQQQIADIRYQQQLDLLTAQGKVQEKVNLERQHELDALRALDASLVAGQQALYDLADANKAKAEQDAKAAAFAEKQADIQSRIDDLTLTDAQKLAKKRAEERAQVADMLPGLGEMLDRLFGIEDASSQTAEALAKAQAEQEAWAKAVNDNLALTIKLESDRVNAMAAAQEMLSGVLTGFANAADNAAHSLDDAKASMRDFLDTLRSQLGVGIGGDSLDQAARAFDRAATTGDFASIASLGQAYADSAKENAASEAEYRQILARIQAITMGSVQAADAKAYQDSLSKELLGAWYSGNEAAAREIIAARTASLASAPIPTGYGQLGQALSNTPALGVNDNGYAALAAEMRGMRAELASIKANTGRGADGSEKAAEVLQGAAHGNLALSTES